MKISKNDLLGILRRFNLANENNTTRQIDQIASSHPSPINQAVKFRFNHRDFAILIDETADDNSDYLFSQIELLGSDTRPELLLNPHAEFKTHGLPYKGKDIYLFKFDLGKFRLDRYLATKYPEWSRSSWQKLIKQGKVSVDGETQYSPKLEISDSQKILIAKDLVATPAEIDLPIVYLDDNIIAIDKPLGVLTHAKNQLDDEPTVASFFTKYTTVGLDGDRPGIVHRLDRDTSGVIVGARTEKAFDSLKSAFANRTVEKTYFAVVEGVPKQDEFIIDLPIMRNPSKPGTFTVHPKGKSAKTSVKLLRSNGKLSLVELRPLTGRTHQLRVHLAYLGLPIRGDRLYGKASERLYLHAGKLALNHNGERHEFISDMPKSFLEAVS